MKKLIRLDIPVVVEGKYDKIRLSNIIDAPIITTNGFGIFKDTQKRELIARLAREKGIIIITDSDNAGMIIRNHIKNIANDGKIINVYLPQILGKEKRKTKASAEGYLGLEGTADDIIISALAKSGITGKKTNTTEKAVTKSDLFTLRFYGAENSADLRKDLLKYLDLPDNLSVNAFLEAINLFYGYDEFLKRVQEWEQVHSKS